MPQDNHFAQLIEEAIQLVPLINRFIHRDDQFCSREHDLTISQIRFMYVLYQEGEATMGKLSESLHVAPPSATTTAERLIKQDLIIRKESPTDRRVVNVSLSKKGRELMEKFLDAKRLRWREIMEGLNPGEREKILVSLRQLASLLEKADRSVNDVRP